MAKTISTEYVGKYTAGIKTPLNEVDIKVNGVDFTPVDLLVSAYASCLMLTVDYEARKNGFESTVSKCDITVEMSEDGSMLGSLSIHLFFKSDLDSEQEKIIETAAKTKCHVGKSLSSDIEKTYRFFYASMSKACNHV